MTLKFEKFKDMCEDFVSVSSKIGDGWCLKTLDKTGTKEVYLEKRLIKLDPSERKSASKDDSALDSNTSFVTFVYHIIYSHSYSVPILCFNAHHANGKLLSLEEIWKNIPECYQNPEPDQKWNMLTQQEHPKLGIPCFMLHPCHTKDLVMCDASSNYIISWLSVVGPVVGLNLSLEYGKLLHHEKY